MISQKDLLQLQMIFFSQNSHKEYFFTIVQQDFSENFASNVFFQKYACPQIWTGHCLSASEYCLQMYNFVTAYY